jgi:hypothetical protein
LALERHHIASRFYEHSRQAVAELGELHAVIFVKLFDEASVKLACTARKQGLKVFVDLCDNVVVPSYALKPSVETLASLAAISAIADAIVFSSPALSDAIRPHLAANARTLTIPDQIESKETVEAAKTVQRRARKVMSRRALAAFYKHPRLARYWAALGQPDLVARRIARMLAGAKPPASFRPEHWTDDRKLVLWFGNHGAAHSNFGMLSLLKTLPAMEEVNRDIPLKLLVISDDRFAFDLALCSLEFPTRFQEWTFQNVFDALSDADVCLVPFGTDAFSLTKSANRAVLALNYGVPVIADGLRSMEPLEGTIVFGDWAAGLRRYLGPDGASARKTAGERARGLLTDAFSSGAIGRDWSALIMEPMRRPRYGVLPGKTAHEIGILIQSEADRRILLPLADTLRSRNAAEIKLLASKEALASPDFVRHCASRGIVPFALKPSYAEQGDHRVLGTLDCLVTAAQNSSEDDARTRAFIKIARRIGVATCEVEWRDQTLTLRTAAVSRVAAGHVALSPAGLAETDSLCDLACRIEELMQAPISFPGG